MLSNIFVPSVVDISGAEMKMLTCFLPSVVDISGAEIIRTVVNNKKRLQHKNETK